MGIEFIQIKLQRKGFNIVNLIVSIYELIQIFRNINPDLIFSYTHKAILGGSLAAKISGFTNIYSLITGTGHIFDSNTVTQKMIKFIGSFALRIALRFNKLVFFQNPDDKLLFLSKKLVASEKVEQVNGSGVNMDKFSFSDLPREPIFLCMARLIKSKGIIEYAKAAQIVKKNYPEARFLLYGYTDHHPDSIDESEIISHWLETYGIEYLGYAKDPIATIKQSSVFVLLSYKEGTPRVVLEAMAMGRPIITADSPGCRETVKDGVNGFLVPTHDHISAANAMNKLLNKNLRSEMGAQSRIYCKEKFDVNDVNKKILSAMNIA